MAKVLIASADGHAGMPETAYRHYFEERYWDDLDELVAAEAASLAATTEMTRFPEPVMEIVDRDHAIRSGGQRGAWDTDVRLREMDREGIAWDLLYMGAGDGETVVQSPFAWELSRAYPADLRSAGARAYNRWLADHIAPARGRLAGAALVGNCYDLDAEVRELEWLAAHGFVAVYAPGTPADPALPPLQDPYYEPFWDACEQLGLRLAFHVNWGVPQEDRFTSHAAAYLELKARGEAASPQQLKERLIAEGGIVDVDMPPRRAVWQLMLGGVLDRHPRLGAILTELRADWAPAVIGYLDERFARGELPTRRRPSEYWAESFRLAPSFIHPAEMAMRDEIGIGQMLYGRDYPHPEGTWPNTAEWLRGALAGVPIDEALRFLGGNAVEWFGLDGRLLRAVADSIGPEADDLLRSEPVAPELVEQFDLRGGYLKPRQTVDLGRIGDVLDLDLATTTGG